MRRLTDRQVAVLAAVERLGIPTLPDLHFEFPNSLRPRSRGRSTLSRLSTSSSRVGNRHFVDLGVGGFGGPRIRPDEIVRFEADRQQRPGS